MDNHHFDYEIDGETYQGFLAPTDKDAPTVMICHAWGGRSQFDDDKAAALAGLGYNGVAIDLFGKGVVGQSKEENQKLIEPFVEDRAMLQKRLHQNMEMVKGLDAVESEKFAAIGFCFGGLCVLDIARSNGAVDGVASFHGLLGAPGNTAKAINPKVLAMHGWDDPMAPPDDVVAFGKEMTDAGADWQLHAYGGVMHAFTNPSADDRDFGTVYNAEADRRSWRAMQNFLEELFA